jgi:hypothetical protein
VRALQNMIALQAHYPTPEPGTVTDRIVGKASWQSPGSFVFGSPGWLFYELVVFDRSAENPTLSFVAKENPEAPESLPAELVF